ncbi:MAG: DUF1801 domain-containing protein [Melioribacteraceae bacterium]|nr:DUF1801 domain-containing protein [Melioribacteraceae bacterium]MCF8263226.1 DUF1801 domain-containing protein [Melioribacteraceae bacterium]MCF8431014.1 DUF1801 domain-containing protein [Melioribacteraceae bacterium]
MKKLIIKKDPEVERKFNNYPQKVRIKLNVLRELILETAGKIETINEIEETLKWGEPSYLVKKGSTIRIDWKEKTPDFYSLYFKCTGKLVPTFKELYGELFIFENNRAIRFELDAEVPQKELKECIEMALRYHLIKNQPLLGKRKISQ